MRSQARANLAPALRDKYFEFYRRHTAALNPDPFVIKEEIRSTTFLPQEP
jgi:hypothetical protein